MAIYQFITDEDFTQVMQAALLAQVHQNDTSKIKRAERTAVQQAKSKLNDRFDLAQVFKSIMAYAAGTTYNSDDYVYHGGEIWKAKVDALTGVEPVEGASWTADDPRDQYLVLIIVNLTLYHLHKRINPRKVPENREDAYHEAMQWLEDVRDMVENPDLPLLENGVDTIQWGSNSKRDHYY